MTELLWEANIEEMKKGYLFEPDSAQFVCLVCGERFEKGIVYPKGTLLYEAERAAAVHLADEHGSMFDYLLQLDKKLTGLSDLQKQLLRMFHDGMSDKEIVSEMNGGSASTIRNHRFMLREKEKQAKLFLVLMELLNEKKTSKPKPDFMPVQRTAPRDGERYAVTVDERQTILNQYFPDGPDGGLSEFPRKEKRKRVILDHMMNRFEPERLYSEKEVNEIIKQVFEDYVTIRRYLIEFGYLSRRDDGSEYWVKDSANVPQKHEEAKAGVFRLVNTVNGKMLVESTPNMYGAWNRIRFGLQTGLLDNPELQKDWNDYGEDKFVFEVLDTWSPEEGAEPNSKERRLQLKEMENRRLEQLQPYGERGYNVPPASKEKSR
nr:DUF2087 domain-containing protein [Paenibacillus mesophilus]